MSTLQHLHLPSSAGFHDAISSKLSLRAGILAGLVGSVAVIIVVTAAVLTAGEDIWIAPRTIASVFFGDNAMTGFFPVIVGTIMHFVTGALEGAIFALILPRLPRAFWIVAGLIYGVAAWVVASFALLPEIAPIMTSIEGYGSVLLIGHVAFGLVLGLFGATYGLYFVEK